MFSPPHGLIEQKWRMNMEKLPLCFLVIVSLSNALAQTDLSGKAFVFPLESEDSYVTLIPLLEKSLKAFTMCLKVYTDLSRACSLFSYATESNYNEILLFKRRVGTYAFQVGDKEVEFKVPETVPAPMHFCATWESESGIAELWVDGKPMVRKALKQGYSVGVKSKIILGQEQDSFGGGFQKTQSLVGDIGDVFMWDFVLLPGEINTVYLGGTFSPNFLDWRGLKFEKKGYVVIKPQLWA
ncbi:C-reactive protein-like isoform X1 [Phascolarctos cinereus]|uniref:Pentraxin family member n=1 Tax=Phascolarctos cinereus TaxID=38626 RepID=A0A6P5JGN9_PHACI|nr:C-reactive protein-like isoform X1 [Phascolarctos cinereus]